MHKTFICFDICFVEKLFIFTKLIYLSMLIDFPIFFENYFSLLHFINQYLFLVEIFLHFYFIYLY